MADQSKRFLLHALSADRYAWAVADAGHLRSAPREGDQTEMTQAWRAAGCEQCWLVLPASECTVWSVSLPRKEQRYASRVIPFRLEEHLLQDLEALHFASRPSSPDTVEVVVTDRTALRARLALLHAAGLKLQACVAPQSLLPRGTVLVRREGLLFHAGSNAVPRYVDGELLDEVASALDVNAIIECIVEADATPLLQRLEAAGVTAPRAQGSLLGLAAALDHCPLDLLQGEFAPRVDWPAQWRVWRYAAIALCAAALLQTLAMATEVWHLRQTDRGLRSRIETEYRGVFPGGVLVDPQAQMRNQLNKLRGGGGGSFVHRFYPVGEALLGMDQATLHSVHFDAQGDGLRIDLSVPRQEQIEALQQTLEQRGIKSELLGSTASAGMIRARLVVK